MEETLICQTSSNHLLAQPPKITKRDSLMGGEIFENLEKIVGNDMLVGGLTYPSEK
jgi:hypothetical protein